MHVDEREQIVYRVPRGELKLSLSSRGRLRPTYELAVFFSYHILRISFSVSFFLFPGVNMMCEPKK